MVMSVETFRRNSKVIKALDYIYSRIEQTGIIPSRKEFIMWGLENLDMGVHGCQTYYYNIKRAIKGDDPYKYHRKIKSTIDQQSVNQ
jgi:hypothetical protein